MKYLGTTIDSNLTWKEQHSSVEKKVAHGCHALFKLLPIGQFFISKYYRKSLLFNLSSSPICNFDLGQSCCNLFNSSEVTS